MSHSSIINHPFSSYSPVSRLAQGESLPGDALPLVVSYADTVATVIPEDQVVAPRATMTVFRGIATSLTGLAQGSLAEIQALIPSYTAQELEATAALFLGTELMSRQRAIVTPLFASSGAGVEIARRRGWTTVEDVTTDLLAHEDDLVRMGLAMLRHHPELAARLAADDAQRSYDDTFQDINRRLDLLAQPEFAPHFEGVPLATEVIGRVREVCRDAAMFRQSREGRLEEQVKMTFRRNVLFTAFIRSVTELQTVLKATLARRHPELIARVDAEYWWSLDRLSRRYRRGEPVEPEPDEVVEPPVPAPAPSVA
jgi:hypothetical protein